MPNVSMTEFRLLGENGSLRGEVEGLSAWKHDPVWRRALLEKLLTLEGYSREQIFEIMFKMKPDAELS